MSFSHKGLLSYGSCRSQTVRNPRRWAVLATNWHALWWQTAFWCQGAHIPWYDVWQTGDRLLSVMLVVLFTCLTVTKHIVVQNLSMYACFQICFFASMGWPIISPQIILLGMPVWEAQIIRVLMLESLKLFHTSAACYIPGNILTQHLTSKFSERVLLLISKASIICRPWTELPVL